MLICVYVNMNIALLCVYIQRIFTYVLMYSYVNMIIHSEF